MISGADFPLVKRAVITFLSLLCCGLIAVAGSTAFVAQAQLDHQNASLQMSDARTRLEQAGMQLHDRQTYAAEYDELLRRHIIGHERRADWMQELEGLRSRKLVLDFRYSLGARLPYIPPAEPDSGNFEVYLNRMSIRFDLLHEGQLLAFLDALHSGSNGWFLLDHCRIERARIEPVDAADLPPPLINGAGSMQDIQPNLRAECSGGWLTMQSRNAL